VAALQPVAAPEAAPEFSDREQIKRTRAEDEQKAAEAIANLGDRGQKPPEPLAVSAQLAPVPRRAPVAETTPTPPNDRRLSAPQVGELNAALLRLSSCGTMTGCVDQAKGALALFGARDSLPSPGPAAIATFRDQLVIYRRAHAEVLRIARELSEAKGGAEHEGSLRKIFESMPASDSWQLSAGELRPIRRHLERAVSRWLQDQRTETRRTISIKVSVLTAAPGVELESKIALESGAPTAAEGEALEKLVAEEMALMPNLERTGRQRLAEFKLVINPSQSVSLE
jgi:hypothetical protein